MHHMTLVALRYVRRQQVPQNVLRTKESLRVIGTSPTRDLPKMGSIRPVLISFKVARILFLSGSLELR